jgi:hypothetical protein
MNWRPILDALARFAALAIVVQTGTVWVCLRWFWTPIQSHYLPAYVWSSLPVLTPATVEVRLIWKTGKHRKLELATEDDAVSSEDGTAMALSQSARDAHWARLMEGPPQQIATARLGPDLSDLAYDGESLWDFLLLPEACAIAVFCFMLFGWFCLKRLCLALIAELAWRRRVSTWQELSPMLFEEYVALAQRASSGVAALHRSAVRRIRLPSAVTSTCAVVVGPTPKPAAFAFPLFGVPNGTGNGGHLWNQRDEIE